MTTIDRNRKSATAMLWIGLMTTFTLLMTKPAQSYNPPPPCEPPQEGCPPNTYWDSDACYCVPCPAKTWSAGAPITVSVSGASEVETCKTISISASASDSDSYTRSPCAGGSSADNITYYWTVQNGTIVGSNTGASITFKAGGSCGAASASVTVGDVGVPHQYSDPSKSKTHNITIIAPSDPEFTGHEDPSFEVDTNVVVSCGAGDTGRSTTVYEPYRNPDPDFDIDAVIVNCKWVPQVSLLRIRTNWEVCALCQWDDSVTKDEYCRYDCELREYPTWFAHPTANCWGDCVDEHESYHSLEENAYALSLVNIANYMNEISVSFNCDAIDTPAEAKAALLEPAKQASFGFWDRFLVVKLAVPHCLAYQEEAWCNQGLSIAGVRPDPDPGTSCLSCNTTNYPLVDNDHCPAN